MRPLCGFLKKFSHNLELSCHFPLLMNAAHGAHLGQGACQSYAANNRKPGIGILACLIPKPIFILVYQRASCYSSYTIEPNHEVQAVRLVFKLDSKDKCSTIKVH